MALNLEELRFVVDTTDLDAAAKKIGALGDALNKINKPVKDSAINAEKLAQAQAKTAEATAQAELAAAKAALAAEKLGKAQDSTSGSSKAQISILEKQIMVLEYMAQGHSRGQASMLATAKVAGAVSTEIDALSTTLKTQRTLMGTDPFDKSIGALESWTNKLKVATEVEQLYNQSLGLTKAQMQELAIEKQRLIALAAMEGKSMQQVEAEYQKIIGVASTLAQKQNTITSTIKQQDKALSDAAKATAYLADADARLAAALDTSNVKLDKAASDALVKYEKALRQTGMSSEEAAAKLAHAKTQFDAIADKKQADKLQYLARAISVQMGDVGISLASGMNPLLVMIQQGDQIRGAIQQAGASGKELEKAMAGAAGQIASSFMDTGKAIGGFFVNAIKGAGSAITNFAGEISGINKLVDAFKVKLVAGGEANFSAIGTLQKIGSAFNILAGIITAGAIAALVAYGFALKEVIKQEQELSKASNLSGGSLGLTTDRAQTLANTFGAAKGNIGDYMKVIGELAKAGNITSNNLENIAKTIVEVSKVTGISSEELAKNFSKISEKPLEGLIPFAKQLGTINVETLKQIQNLEKSGKYTEAAKLATEAYSKSLKEAADGIKKDMGWIESFFYSIGKAAKSMWDAILNIGRKGTLEDQLNKAVDKMKELQSAGGTNTGRKDRMVTYQAEVISGILAQIEAEKKLGDTKAKNSKDATDFERNLKQQGGTNFKVPEDLYLKRIKEEYADTTKTIDSEFKKLLADNKTNYDLGIIDLGTYLSNENSLITQQNNQKIQTNSDYVKSLTAARDIQLRAIDDMVAKEATKNKTTQDSEKLQKDYKDSIDSTKEAYAGLTANIITNNEVLKDKSIEEQLKSLARLGSLTKKVVEDSKEFIKSIDDTAAKRKLQIDLENQLSSLSGGELARVKAQIDAEQNHITKLSALQKAADEAAVALAELGLQGLTADSEQYAKAENAIKAANKRLEEAKAKSRQEIVQAGIDAEMLYYTQEYNKLKSNISDALVTALFDGGKAGSKKLRDVIVAELKKPVTVMVNAVVNTLMNSLTGSATSGAGGSLAGNLLGSAFSNTIGNISIGGSTLAAAGEAFGTGFMTTIQGGSVAEAAAAYGSAGMSGVSTGLSVGAQAAAAIPYVAGALLVANALGLFRSTSQVGGGITGTLGSGNVNSYAVMRESGTLFSGPDYWTQDTGKFSGSDALQTSFQALKDNVSRMAEAMNLSSDSVKKFTKDISISFDGLTSAQIQEKIATTFAGIGDELAALVLGVGATAAQLTTLYTNVMQQRYDLETQLLTLQGNTTELRKRERATIYASNQALYDQIKALEDQKAANELAATAMAKLTSITTTIVDEINRLRGANVSQAGLEAQFATLTAQARAGDLTALAKLPEITKGLEAIAGATAVNATDIIIARARLAQSLQDTLGYAGANSLLTSTTAVSTTPVSVISSGGATSTVSATSSNQELLSALVIEVQGLRAEVRADVSHNAKTAKILERVNQDGETLNVTTVV